MFPITAPPVAAFLQRPPCGVLAGALNRLFSTALADGELDFLQGRVLGVVLSDTPVSFHLALVENRLTVAPGCGHWDIRISGRPYDFMLLAARTIDTDSLFFQRRLKVEGNTELGLFLKNFLDAQDLSDLPYAALLDTALHKAIDLHHWWSPTR